MTESLAETFFEVHPDVTYRRQTRHIVLATVESMVPLRSTLDPSIWAGGGISAYTWGRVQRSFARLPQARHGTMPMHYYAEYLGDDYVTFVGAPLTSASWFMREAAAAGVVAPALGDAVLIALQENYAVEVTEMRLWRLLAANVITPLMRMLHVPRDRVVFFEQVCDADVARSGAWPYNYRSPKFLDGHQLETALKVFHKDA